MQFPHPLVIVIGVHFDYQKMFVGTVVVLVQMVMRMVIRMVIRICILYAHVRVDGFLVMVLVLVLVRMVMQMEIQICLFFEHFRIGGILVMVLVMWVTVTVLVIQKVMPNLPARKRRFQKACRGWIFQLVLLHPQNLSELAFQKIDLTCFV